jgi:F0F1-type ATP synthase membrane subunit c/vacuolar-type H+-ATPase subunit K
MMIEEEVLSFINVRADVLGFKAPIQRPVWRKKHRRTIVMGMWIGSFIAVLGLAFGFILK